MPDGQVGDHGRQRRRQGPAEGRDASAAGGGGIHGQLVGEAAQGHADERPARLADLVLDDLLFRLEGRDIVEPEGADGHPDELLLGDARALALLLEVVAAGHEERFLGDEADELAPGHAQAELAGQPDGFVEDDVDRRRLVVREVDRDLGHPVILDVPADGLDLLELARDLDRVAAGVLDDVAVLVALGPAALAQAQGDLVGQLAVAGVEVEVVGDQELAGADDGRPGLGIEDGLAEIRGPARVLELLGKPFVFAGPDRGQVPALGLAGRGLIEVDGNAQLGGDPAPELAGQPDAVLHRHAGDRDEGADVGRADAAVGALVGAHVDDLGGLGDGPERGLPDRLGRADEGHDGPVRRSAGVDVEELDARHGLDLAR